MRGDGVIMPGGLPIGSYETIIHLIIPRMQLLISILIAVALGAGVSYAANDALPGDGLYAVKVEVNERLREAVAVDDAARARVHVQFAERRLDESETVTATSTLRAEIAAQLRENFDRHADALHERVEDMEEEGRAEDALEATSDFEASLEAHAHILAALETVAEPGEERSAVGDLRAAAEEEEEDTEEVRERLEADVTAGPDVRPAAEGRLGAAENKIAEVRKYIDRTEALLGAAATANARARLAVAEQTVGEGVAKLEAAAYADAFVLFLVAHRIAQEAQLLAAANLDLDVELDKDEREAEDEAEDDVSETGIRVEFDDDIEDEDEDDDMDDEEDAEDDEEDDDEKKIDADVDVDVDLSY